MATGALTSLIHAVARASDHDLFWAAFVAADLAIWILRERWWRRRLAAERGDALIKGRREGREQLFDEMRRRRSEIGL